jgi:excisionase family DNA binding protein
MMADEERVTMTVPEAAKALGIGKNQGYEAARAGQIPTIRIGKRLLVPRAAFERLLEKGTSQSEARSVA